MATFSLMCLLLTALFVLATNGIPTISVTGSKFFTSDGKQFYIKGVAYQLVEDDPLVDIAQCQRDAALMQKLGANSIRVYHVNATADHTACMNAFAQAGIYLWVDLDSFKTYIKLGTTPSWTSDKAASYRAVMENFQQYNNTAGFFVGNEVLNDLNDSGSAPYLLSATLDLRSYAKSKGYRRIPIGYSATDTGALPMLQDYLVCRPNSDERLDFYALNSYRWCGPSTFEQSGYDTILKSTENYPVPIFFSEIGCNTVPPRTFTDQDAVFGQMADVWSGAIIYEWIQEMNDYGLISYGPTQDASINDGSRVVQGFTRSGTPTPIAPDFTNLQNQWATLHPTGIRSTAYAATFKTTLPACPASSAGGWTVDPSAPLPTMVEVAVSGMTTRLPSSIPSGSITVEPSSLASSDSGTENGPGGSPAPSDSASNLPATGQTPSPSRTGAGPAASSSSQAAGILLAPFPLDSNRNVFFRAFVAIASIAIGAILLL